MARSGDTSFEPNQRWFDTILRSAPVEAVVDQTAGRTQAHAKAHAPVDTADYRDGIRIEHRESRYRRVTRVVGTDEKTMIIEAKTGNLARALKATKQ